MPASDVTIRPALTDDVPQLVALLREQFTEHEIHLEVREVEDGIRGLLERPDRGLILAAERGQSLIGLAVMSFVWTVEHAGLSAWLDELFVVAPERGLGIGARLAATAVASAHDAGCLAVDLEVDQGHHRVEHLYERLGFRRHQRRRWVKRLATR
jgi:ribosomal protein S18 acetylase RimI-like enzyme